MISLQKQFLFIHIPKTGGNSIQNILKNYSEDDIVVTGKHQDGIERFEVRNKKYKIIKHSALSDYKSTLPSNTYQALFKFATIRNPWDMMISFYFSPHRGITEFNRDEFINLVEKTPTLRHYICERSAWQKAAEKLGLNVFDHKDRIDKDIDYLIRFEQLEHDFKLVCEKLGLPPVRLPRRNSSKRAHYSEYYDDELQEIVRTKFIEEVSFGNYSFDDA